MSSKLYLLTLTSLLLISGFSECKKKDDIVPKSTTKIAYDTTAPKVITYLALGDSYTKAECETTMNGYPAQLVDTFQNTNIEVKSYKIIAQTGWRTDNLKNAINAAAIQDTFDLVSLLIGVNNQYQGRSPDAYRIEFRELLEMAIFYAKGNKDNVFVLSIPDYGATPFGCPNSVSIGQQIDLFNQINKEVTDSMEVAYFDITPISREAKTDPSLTCTDGLHPSGKMYKRWVDLIFPSVLQLAKQP